MLSGPPCTLCLTVKRKTQNIQNTNLQTLYEKLADFKIKTECWMCYFCYTRLQQCHRLQQLAVQTRGLIDNIYQNKTDVKLQEFEPIVELSLIETRVISSITSYNNELHESLHQTLDKKLEPCSGEDDEDLNEENNHREESFLDTYNICNASNESNKHNNSAYEPKSSFIASEENAQSNIVLEKYEGNDHVANIADVIRKIKSENDADENDSPLDFEAQLNATVTCDNSPHDFDSDDSIRDRDCYPSGSLVRPLSYVSEKINEKKKYRPQTNLPTDVAMNITVTNMQTLKRRRHTVGTARCKKIMPERRFLQNTDDGNDYCMLPVDCEVNIISNKNFLEQSPCCTTSPQQQFLRKRCGSADDKYYSSLPEILQPLRKRKKNSTSLEQRKLDAKNERKIKHGVQPACNEKCYKKCMSFFNEDERKYINKSYWDMSWQEQHAFVEASTYVIVPKRKITSQPKRQPKRGFVMKKQDGTRIDVCKIFFLTTLGYSRLNDRILHTTYSDPSTDRRGKHQKTLQFDRNLLDQHVESFNPSEPHYKCEHALSQRYLPSDITITQMHKHFCETYPNKHVSYSLYRSHVKKMNISFTTVGDEECELCKAYLY